MNGHSSQRQNILAQYKVKKEELLKGVQCEECFIIAMLKENRDGVAQTVIVRLNMLIYVLYKTTHFCLER